MFKLICILVTDKLPKQLKTFVTNETTTGLPTDGLSEAVGGQVELTSVQKPDQTVVPDLDLGNGHELELGDLGRSSGAEGAGCDTEMTENTANLRMEREAASGEDTALGKL